MMLMPFFKEGIGKYNTNQEKDFIEKVYAVCTNISIDYGVMEKAKMFMFWPQSLAGPIWAPGVRFTKSAPKTKAKMPLLGKMY